MQRVYWPFGNVSNLSNYEKLRTKRIEKVRNTQKLINQIAVSISNILSRKRLFFVFCFTPILTKLSSTRLEKKMISCAAVALRAAIRKCPLSPKLSGKLN